MERLTGLTDLARENNFMVIYPEGYKKAGTMVMIPKKLQEKILMMYHFYLQ